MLIVIKLGVLRISTLVESRLSSYEFKRLEEGLVFFSLIVVRFSRSAVPVLDLFVNIARD